MDPWADNPWAPPDDLAADADWRPPPPPDVEGDDDDGDDFYMNHPNFLGSDDD